MTMACCLAGSLFYLALAAVVRTIKQRMLGIQPERPEAWRLPPD
jgi:hypothetical protein